ncbi:lasso peptide biosynthesis B2 protein [Streptomyces sp. NPDC059740]|uniref:lasso peptide biosynthesis B2 protein n=1 Tax=Streptomyces sp. NPDC059740 TaxID=3346926 RepID=UPI00365A2355
MRLRRRRARQAVALPRAGPAAAAPGRGPGTAGQTLPARTVVSAVSRRCAGPQGCLRRSPATVVLSRLRGVRPTWCTGVRTHPFSVHAWVAVEGPSATGRTPVLTVPPLSSPDVPGHRADPGSRGQDLPGAVLTSARCGPATG